jgi:hypothetical protein
MTTDGLTEQNGHGDCWLRHAPLLDRIAAALQHAASTLRLEQIHTQLQSLLPNEQDCILCGVRNRAEQDAIDVAAKRLERDSTRALNGLSAICFPHFVMLVDLPLNFHPAAIRASAVDTPFGAV